MVFLQHCEEIEQGFMFSGIKDSYDSWEFGFET